MPQTYYETLGIPRDATPDQIQTAYKKLALKYHPDKNRGKEKESEALFKLVVNAKDVLSDPTQRRAYDKQLSPMDRSAPSSGSSFTRAPSSSSYSAAQSNRSNPAPSSSRPTSSNLPSKADIQREASAAQNVRALKSMLDRTPEELKQFVWDSINFKKLMAGCIGDSDRSLILDYLKKTTTPIIKLGQLIEQIYERQLREWEFDVEIYRIVFHAINKKIIENKDNFNFLLKNIPIETQREYVTVHLYYRYINNTEDLNFFLSNQLMFTPGVVKKLEAKGLNGKHLIFLDHAIKEHLSGKDGWLEIVSLLLKGAKPGLPLCTSLNNGHLITNTALGLTLFMFEPNPKNFPAINQVSMPDIMRCANIEQLEGIIERSSHLQKHDLRILSEQCKTDKLISLFISRVLFSSIDVSFMEDAYLELLRQPEITKVHLLAFCNKRSTPNILAAISAHPQADAEVHSELYKHSALTADVLFSWISNTTPNAALIAQVLQTNPSKINGSLLLHIATSLLLNDQILINLMAHPAISPEVITTALTSSLMSPKLLQELLSSKQHKFSFIVLKRLADYAVQRDWPEELTLILHAIKAQGTLCLIDSLDCGKPITKPSIGLAMLICEARESIFRPIKQLNIDSILAGCSDDQLNSFLKTKSISTLPSSLALSILKKTNDARIIELFVKHAMQSASETSIKLGLVSHPYINSQQLLHLMSHINKGELLEQAYQNPNATDAVRNQFYNHASVYPENLVRLIDAHKVSSVDMVSILDLPRTVCINRSTLLSALNEFSDNTVVVAKICNHPFADQIILAQGIQHLFNLYSAQPENNILIERTLIGAFKRLSNLSPGAVKNLILTNSALISPAVGISILELNKGFEADLPLDRILRLSNEHVLSDIIAIKNLSSSVIDQIAERELTKAQTEALLDKNNISLTAVKLLFSKTHSSPSDTSLPEDSKQSILSILEQTKSYTAFREALYDSACTHQDKRTILARFKTHYSDLQQKADKQPSAVHSLDAALAKLRLKALTHMSHAKTNSHYAEVAQITFELYQTLSSQKEKICSGNSAVIQAMSQNIYNAMPVLAEHRGYKQVFLDILNSFLSLFVSNKNRRAPDRFFKANTDSINVAEHLNECIRKCEPTVILDSEISRCKFDFN